MPFLPLIVTLIFLLVIAVYCLGSFFILYHLIRFGVGTRPKQAALVFLAGSLLLLFLSSITLLISYPSITAYVQKSQSFFIITPNVKVKTR